MLLGLALCCHSNHRTYFYFCASSSLSDRASSCFSMLWTVFSVSFLIWLFSTYSKLLSFIFYAFYFHPSSLHDCCWYFPCLCMIFFFSFLIGFWLCSCYDVRFWFMLWWLKKKKINVISVHFHYNNNCNKVLNPLGFFNKVSSLTSFQSYIKKFWNLFAFLIKFFFFFSF